MAISTISKGVFGHVIGNHTRTAPSHLSRMFCSSQSETCTVPLCPSSQVLETTIIISVDLTCSWYLKGIKSFCVSLQLIQYLKDPLRLQQISFTIFFSLSFSLFLVCACVCSSMPISTEMWKSKLFITLNYYV